MKQNYYYRRQVNKKSYRISLRTKDLKVALYRQKLFNLMAKDEFVYTMELGDYKYIFEYDDINDLKEQMALTKELHKDIIQEEAQYTKVNNAIQIEQEKTKEQRSENTTFAQLEVMFVAHIKQVDLDKGKKTSKSSWKAYAGAFNKLKKYFEDTYIQNLTKEQYRAYRDYLTRDLKLKNNTTNIQMIYLSKFLNLALEEELITTNEAKKVLPLEEEELEKELFTKDDIKNIFEYGYDEYHKNIFKILLYSGMRISELYNLKDENIKKDENNIFYFDIKEAKTKAGNRKIPIHKDILELVQSLKFPISQKSNNAFQKEVLKELYNVIDKNSTKSTHTFRANFISECINNFPDKIVIIQEISGHSLGEDRDLTIKRYGKGFTLKLKKEIVDSVQFK